jgi:magnesium transporter
MPADAQRALTQAMDPKEAAAVLNLVADDDRTEFLSELTAAQTREILSLLTPQESAEAATLLKYPRGVVGRLMTTHYIAVREDWTIAQVLEYIRKYGENSETLNVIYVVDAQGVLIDDIRIRELLVVPLETKMSDLMDRRYVILHTMDRQEDALELFRREDRTALPVVDDNGCLVGIVTVDDVLDVAAETATREMQKFGGSEALDEPYMRVTLGRMVRKRAGWLVVLFLGEMLTATAMGFFEKEIARAVVLALFVPLIISSGGNSGSQASTLVIRALAVGDVLLADFWKVIRRELLAGLALGGILGAIGFLRISI